MSTTLQNKIVFRENKISHPFIDMEGVEQVSYSLDNDLVRNYLNNVTYKKTDIITSSNTKSSTNTKIRPYFKGKTHRKPEGSSISAWSEAERPVIISGTHAGDTLIFTSLDYSTTVTASEGATLVYNLIPRRFYECKIKRGNTVVDTRYFLAEGQCRMIRIPIPNFRDIGGWKCDGGTVSYDKVFRGCGFVGNGTAWVTLKNASNKADVIATLLKLGITDELDLREPDDGVQSAEDPEYGDAAINYTNISTGAYAIDGSVVRALLHIADVLNNDGKVWLHCFTGADRAGTLVTLIQVLLGCDIDSIIKEWELSMFNGNGYNENYLENTNFRTFLYNQYKVNTSKSLYENVVTTIKSKKPSGVTNSDIDAMIATFKSKMVTKTMAIIGDSYSGYSGSGPKIKIEGHNHPYAGEYPSPNPLSVNAIWWAIVAQHFGWSAANYSWSGCTVTPSSKLDERIGCSDERINRLSYLTGGVAPDIIFCELGMNDARYIDVNAAFTWNTIEAAYRSMLTKIITTYPDAKVYCINCIHRETSAVWYTKHQLFNEKLATWLEDYPGVKLIDAADVFNYTSVGNTVSDATHPSAAGFRKIAQRVISVIEPDFAEDDPQEEVEPVSYAFAANHCSSRGVQGGPSEYGYQKQTNDYTAWEFAEFPVSAGDVIQVGTNDGEKLGTGFTESRDGFLDAMSRLSYAQTISSGWYSGCFNYSYTGANYFIKNNKTMIYQQYTAQHDCILTVALAVGSKSVSARGGSYVKINGVTVG